jgi:anti-anti-sigma regulatory factor/HAMP domain-containing protein
LASVGLLASSTVGYLGYSASHEALRSRSFGQLTAVRDLRAEQVESYIGRIQSQLVALAQEPTTVAAMRSLSEGFRSADGFGNDATAAGGDTALRAYYEKEFLPALRRAASQDGSDLADHWPGDPLAQRAQQRYIAANPQATGSKHLFDGGAGEGEYDAAHRRFHPYFRNHLDRFGYYDIFLVDRATGHIVYSVFKEVDFGTSLLTGPHRESNLAQAFREASRSSDTSFAVLVDFEPYAPSYRSRASFVATPIVDGGKVLGVLAFQIPIDRLNAIMTSDQEWQGRGFGLSGETYLVGPDSTLRSEPRFLLEDRTNYLRQLREVGVPPELVRRIDSQDSAIGIQPVRTSAVGAALAGRTGTDAILDYRGVEVLSAYTPVQVPDVQWVLLSEIDAAEALGDAHRLRRNALLLQLVVLVGVVLVAFAFADRLVSPIQELVGLTRKIGAGDLSVHASSARADELGDLARGFEAMRGSLQDFVARQERALEALSTPMIPLSDEIVAAPLVGELDPQRVEHTRGVITEGIHAMRARALLLDLTGVPDIDERSHRGILDLIAAVEMLGAKVVVTGMRPRVAKVFVATEGVALTAERTLQDGQRTAEAMLRRGAEDTASHPLDTLRQSK